VEPETRAEKTVQLGVPRDIFEHAIDALAGSRQEGKSQVFLTKDNQIRFIGNVGELRLAIGKKFGSDTIDKRQTERVLEEVQTFLQVLLWSGNSARAAKTLEQNVYTQQFRSVKGNEAKQLLRQQVLDKLDLVSKLSSPSLLERRKRLSSASGPLIDDIDIELVTQRYSQPDSKEVTAPFLRIRLKLIKPEHQLPIFFPPWMASPVRTTESLDLECDESDIDLMMRRLAQAKGVLANAMSEKVEKR
jgi:hypothetical protein